MMERLLAKLEDKMDANQKKAEADKKDLLTRMETKIDAYHEKRMVMFHAYEKRMMACLGQTEANTEENEINPGMMQSAEEHQDIPTEDVTVMPVGRPRKRRRVRKSTAG
jgi:hypothetical protein